MLFRDRAKNVSPVFDDERYSSFGPEGDPIKTKTAFITTVADKKNIQNYQQTGSLLGTKMLDDSRREFVDAIDKAVSPEDAAFKLKELMNAHNRVTIEGPNGVEEVVKSPDYKVQIKAMDLYSEIKGLKAPVKSVRANIPAKDIELLVPEARIIDANPSQAIDEGSEYATKRLESVSNGKSLRAIAAGSDNAAGDKAGSNGSGSKS